MLTTLSRLRLVAVSHGGGHHKLGVTLGKEEIGLPCPEPKGDRERGAQMHTNRLLVQQ